ncbi:unnamed protein product [Rotaria sp. Silwood1]|nr:unnamed protein product [Rotaria sp. Silwood1]CAF1555102.1 unnamed protein product [Rotaria sp. Silwood1]CAF3583123.1 unnamed protein product [Rotaria sp. Silwood1]CAF3641414.1 unnamed protein product [Rotaria sp. Silwood1]CAF4777966.1 unnamed protein product [Rotaria sp. Silwood1]
MARNNAENNHEETLQTTIQFDHHICSLVQGNVNEFLKLREELLTNANIRRLAGFNDVLARLIDGSRIKQLNSRISSDKLHIALCGENSSGKTAFLHTFLGIGKILPSGDGPVTARITKLTYASSEQACIYVRKTLRDQTLVEDKVNLSAFFISEKPQWINVGRALSKHVKRPEDIDPASHEFAEWARCLVEIHIPSPTLALGIDVYDTPGFLSDDAPVLKEILHELVELIHPTIIFMYGNPSTDDATKGCFLAMKTALQDLDSTNIFFLNSKADITKMPKFKNGMNVDEFRAVLADERAQRYHLLLRAPFLSNDRLEGLPASIDECYCFDLCSVNSQSIKPYGPLMNETTVQNIIQFVVNNDIAMGTRACKVILPIIDAFFSLLILTSHRTLGHLLKLRNDAMKWEKNYFQAYTMHIEICLSNLFSNIFQQFNTQKQCITEALSNIRTNSDPFQPTLITTVRLQIIKPAVRDTLRTFMNYVLEHIIGNNDFPQNAAFNEILIGALGTQEISDFVALLLGELKMKTTVSAGILYMVNTISIPIVQCARNLENLNFSDEITGDTLLAYTKEPHSNQNEISKQQIDGIVHRYLLSMQKIIKKQQDTMQQAVRLWGDQQKATLRSLIDYHYEKVLPQLDSHEEILNHLEQYAPRLIMIECRLCATEDMAKFNDSKPKICSGNVKSTVFSIFTSNWGEEKNLVVKKLSRSLINQPMAAYYEAHYHRQVANLCHPNIINLRYFYEHYLEDGTSELWMIFPSLTQSLAQFLSQCSTTLSIKMVLQWMNDIVDALITLHENALVHRNVVLSNIIVTEESRVLLIDLGDWCEDCDLSLRHKLSLTFNGTNDDIRGFGRFADIGNILPAGIGPVTAHIVQLTYAPAEQAFFRVYDTIEKTSVQCEGDLSHLFENQLQPNWAGVTDIIQPHVKRPSYIDEKSPEFNEWAKCFVEIALPSKVLALGIDIYDTPGFLSDNREQVLTDNLHKLVKRIKPTLVFLYENSTISDTDKNCFLAMKNALGSMGRVSVFFLNTKADCISIANDYLLDDDPESVTSDLFSDKLREKRQHCYNLLLRRREMANEVLGGLPKLVDECPCFDICTVPGDFDPWEEYSNLINTFSFQRLVEYVVKAYSTPTLTLARDILFTIDDYFDVTVSTSVRLPNQWKALRDEAIKWGRKFFDEYKKILPTLTDDLTTNILNLLERSKGEIVKQAALMIRNDDPIDRLLQDSRKTIIDYVRIAVQEQVIKVAANDVIIKRRDEVKNFIAGHFQQ